MCIYTHTPHRLRYRYVVFWIYKFIELYKYIYTYMYIDSLIV